jgi:hypothetical protein
MVGRVITDPSLGFLSPFEVVPRVLILIPPALREVKLLVHVSSMDCQPTWLRIEPPGSQFKDLISSNAHRGS